MTMVERHYALLCGRLTNPSVRPTRQLKIRDVHGMGIYENGNTTRNWKWKWEVMGKHLSGNGNYLHSHGNLFPQVLCCSKLIKFVSRVTCQMSMPFVPNVPTTEI